jgi:hypothetical protein
MRTHTRKATTLATLFIAIMLCICNGSYAQATNQPKMILKLGTADISGKSTVTTDQVLADPQLLFSDPSCIVVSFTLSFQPHDKDFIGPYVTQGAKLTAKEIDIFRQLKADGVSRTKVFFEDIKAHGPDGQIRSMSPVIFNLVQ